MDEASEVFGWISQVVGFQRCPRPPECQIRRRFSFSTQNPYCHKFIIAFLESHFVSAANTELSPDLGLRILDFRESSFDQIASSFVNGGSSWKVSNFSRGNLELDSPSIGMLLFSYLFVNQFLCFMVFWWNHITKFHGSSLSVNEVWYFNRSLMNYAENCLLFSKLNPIYATSFIDSILRFIFFRVGKKKRAFS